MSDEQKPIQTPFDETVPSIQQERDTDNPGEERIREDFGLGDDGLADRLEDAEEADYDDQYDQETYDEDYDNRA